MDTACNLGQADPSETPGGHSVYHMLNTRLHVWVISIDWTFLQSAWLVEVYILQYVHIMPVLSFAKHVVVLKKCYINKVNYINIFCNNGHTIRKKYCTYKYFTN